MVRMETGVGDEELPFQAAPASCSKASKTHGGGRLFHREDRRLNPFMSSRTPEVSARSVDALLFLVLAAMMGIVLSLESVLWDSLGVSSHIRAGTFGESPALSPPVR